MNDNEYYTKKEAVELLGIPEKDFENYYKNSKEIKRVDGQRHILFYKKDIEEFKKMKEARTIVLSLGEYEKCFEFAIKVVYGGAALHGIRGRRSEVQASDDWILGILAEHAFKRFLREKFDFEIRLDEKVHPGDITPQDIVAVIKDGKEREPRKRIGIKASKTKNAFLILTQNEFEREDRHSDIYVFARVGLPTDHLFRILRDHSFFKNVKEWLESHHENGFRLIDVLENVPVWITGYIEAENLDKVNEIPGQKFEAGYRYVKSVAQLKNGDEDWRRFIDIL